MADCCSTIEALFLDRCLAPLSNTLYYSLSISSDISADFMACKIMSRKENNKANKVSIRIKDKETLLLLLIGWGG